MFDLARLTRAALVLMALAAAAPRVEAAGISPACASASAAFDKMPPRDALRQAQTALPNGSRYVSDMSGPALPTGRSATIQIMKIPAAETPAPCYKVVLKGEGDRVLYAPIRSTTTLVENDLKRVDITFGVPEALGSIPLQRAIIFLIGHDENGEITYLTSEQGFVSPLWFVWTGSITFVLLAYMIAALKGGDGLKLNPLRLIVGGNGEASLTHAQALFFTLIIAWVLAHLFLRTGNLFSLPTELLALMGISAAGAMGSQLTSQTKEAPVRAFLQAKRWHHAPQDPSRKRAPSFQDLVSSNGTLDVYKFQMLIFSLLVGCYVAANGSIDLDKVQISDSMLGLLGISQLVYVGAKATSDQVSAFNDRASVLLQVRNRWLEAKLALRQAQVRGDAAAEAVQQMIMADAQAVWDAEVEAVAAEFTLLSGRVPEPDMKTLS